MNRIRILFLALMFTISGLSNRLSGQEIDFSRLSIFSPGQHDPQAGPAITILQEEIKKRTGRLPQLIHTMTAGKTPVIAITSLDNLSLLPKIWQHSIAEMPATGKDGFKLWLDPHSPTIVITARDTRSLIYGAGRFLRKALMTQEGIKVPANISLSSTPVYSIRGHQLGYRPKTNAYDAFTVARFDQYIRELALFGANSIEIVPPRTDDDATSSHMTLTPIKMIAQQAAICEKYGLDVWIWYPNMGADYLDRKTVEAELKERDTVFAALRKLDAVFVPGGDPGELEPDVLFSWLAKEAIVLHKHHPAAKIWVSPQVFRPTRHWLNEFCRYANKKYSWFGGVVFGPWIKTPLDSLRGIIDPSIPIRIYPDITHSLSSQYPVPDWDLAYAMTLGRECINPRPLDEKHIHNTFARFGTGSISYSEGTNDDVNKFIWSAQDWNPNTTAEETLEDYARFFVGPAYVSAMVSGILSLEENFRGPLLTNPTVLKTLGIFREMEAKSNTLLARNFRFQMCLLRAYFDALVQKRLVIETAIEAKAYEALAMAANKGSLSAIEDAERILDSGRPDTTDPYRTKCMALADSLYKSIGAQLTVARHGAADGRGNFIDNIDVPLNDAPWLKQQLHQIIKMGNEDYRLKAIHAIIHRTDPGPDGIYAHFGIPASHELVKQGAGWSKDPGGLESPMVNFGVGTREDEWVHEIRPIGFGGQIVPRAWMVQIGTLYQQPLEIHYSSLDSTCAYQIKIAYTGRFRSIIRLQANGYLVHDNLQTGAEPLYSFEIPKGIIKNRILDLSFTCPEGEQGAQVSEIWLIRK